MELFFVLNHWAFWFLEKVELQTEWQVWYWKFPYKGCYLNWIRPRKSLHHLHDRVICWCNLSLQPVYADIAINKPLCADIFNASGGEKRRFLSHVHSLSGVHGAANSLRSPSALWIAATKAYRVRARTHAHRHTDQTHGHITIWVLEKMSAMIIWTHPQCTGPSYYQSWYKRCGSD